MILILIIICSSCSGIKKADKITSVLSIDSSTIYLNNEGGNSLKIVYTGCGGFLIQQDTTAILIDPYFSNINPLPLILLKKIRTDTIVVNDFFTQHFGNSKDTNGIIKAILVAHSHYDHLADVPSIYLHNCNGDSTEIIGSPTTKHILKSIELEKDITLIEPIKELNSNNIQHENYNWIYTKNKKVRVLPIPTEHAPHFCGMKFISSKKLTQDLSKYPTKVRKFPEGENYNFIIDILDSIGEIKFRIFSHAGAACEGEIGIPEDNLLNEKDVDVLFLCVANFNQVENYPEKVIQRLKPKFIIGNHWENFFRAYNKNIIRPATVPGTNVKKFILKVNQQLKKLNLKDSTNLFLPLPNTTIEIVY